VVDSGSADPYTDSLGHIWHADQAYVPGLTAWGYLPAGASTYANNHTIAGASEPILYQTERWWHESGGYRAEVPNGYYRVELRFAEIYPWAGLGGRVFSIAIEGARLVAGLDVAARVGRYVAYDLTLDTYVGDGLLSLDLLAQVGGPAIKAWAILPVAPCGEGATPTPTSVAGVAHYRVNAGGEAYVDAAAQTWAADQPTRREDGATSAA